MTEDDLTNLFKTMYAAVAPPVPNMKKINVLGMELEQWTYASCVAEVATGPDWATLYTIESSDPGKGHATHLLSVLKAHYEGEGKHFRGTVALNERMKAIYGRLGIEEAGEE